MNTIKVNQEIEFKSISLDDAIKMVGLMDRLVESINVNNVNKIVKKLKDKNRNFQSKYYNPVIDAKSDENIYHILYDLGFRSKVQLEEYNEQYIIDNFKEFNK